MTTENQTELILELCIVSDVLNRLNMARSVHGKVPAMPIYVTETFHYEKTMRDLADYKSSILKWLVEEIGEDRLKIEKDKCDLRLHATIIRDCARKLMHVGAQKDPAKANQLKRVVEEAEKLIKMDEEESYWNEFSRRKNEKKA